MEKIEEELVGVKEIARRANVSIATVDRVLHNRTGVSDKTREKINAIIKELNYQPNLFARRLASRKVFRFGALIPDVSSETAYWQGPLNGLNQAESELNQYGIIVEKFFFDQNNKDSFAEQFKLALDSKIDGLVIAPVFAKVAVQFTDTCKKQKIPFVFINNNIPTQESLCYIGADLFKSGYLSASLAKYAHANSKILVLNIAKKIKKQSYIKLKEGGFRQYFEDKNIPTEIIQVNIKKTEYDAVEEALVDALEKEPDISAIFVTNSRVFLVARFLEKRGKGNIVLIGYDFTEENIKCLEQEMIDFLICQKPEEQGYRGIMALYNNLILKNKLKAIYHMPIDIVTKENYEFYRS